MNDLPSSPNPQSNHGPRSTNYDLRTKRGLALSLPKGFTLTEVLIVVAILAILMMVAIVSLMGNREKAEDARVKAELDRLKIAFEDYYNDNGCYPPAEWFDSSDDCGSSNLSPYLSAIPCDKKTDKPYVVETDGTTCSSWFKIYSTLRITTDPSILKLCSSGGSTLGNYGVSSTNTSVSIDCSAIPSPGSSSTPSNTPLPSGSNYYYCSGIGNCTVLPEGLSCSPTYLNDSNCGDNCPVAATCN